MNDYLSEFKSQPKTKYYCTDYLKSDGFTPSMMMVMSTSLKCMQMHAFGMRIIQNLLCLRTHIHNPCSNQNSTHL